MEKIEMCESEVEAEELPLKKQRRTCRCYWCWPLATGVLLLLSIIMCYIMAGIYEHATWWFPIISWTGNEIPERETFGHLINITALLLFFTAVVRYKMYYAVDDAGQRRWFHHGMCCRCLGWLPCISCPDRFKREIAFMFALMSCLGFTMMGNFENDCGYKMMEVYHQVGASLAFVFGSVFMGMDTYLSWFYLRRMRVTSSRSRLCLCCWSYALRAVLTVVSFCGAGIFVACMGASEWQYDGCDKKGRYDWDRKDPAFKVHVAAAVCEWIPAVCLVIYFLSITTDFCDIKKLTMNIELNPPVYYI